MPEDTRSDQGEDTTDVAPRMAVHRSHGDPRPAAVTFVTTEHFTLQGARAATIAESTGRASMFLLSVSGGVVALGLIATATRVGTAFYAFGLILLPTLTFVGFVTFERVMQSGMEDLEYARRIALLRGYYFDEAPELSFVPDERPGTRSPSRARITGGALASIPNGRGHGGGDHGGARGLRYRAARRRRFGALAGRRACCRRCSGRRRARRDDALAAVRVGTGRVRAGELRRRRPGARAAVVGSTSAFT